MQQGAVRNTSAHDAPAYFSPLEGIDHNTNPATGSAGEHPLYKYFGEPNGNVDFDPRDRRWERNFTLPKAFEGQNQYLGEVVEGLILRDATFYTSASCLPIRRTDQMNFEFSQWNFDTPLLNPVPEEGVSRLIRSTYSRKSAATRRYGIAFVVEHGFWKTSEGRTHYVRSLQQIANSTILTANYDVLIKLLQSRAYDVEWHRKNGLFESPVEELIKITVERFAALQKGDLQGDFVLDKAKLLLQSRGVDPTTLIIPPETSFYWRGVGEDKLNYSNAGPLAVTARTADIRNIGSARGISVHQTQSFNLYNDAAPPLDPMVRNRMTGVYYEMRFDPHAVGPGYTSSMRDIFIHNANTDEMERVSFLEALRYCGMFNPDGTRTRGVPWATLGDFAADAMDDECVAAMNNTPGWRNVGFEYNAIRRLHQGNNPVPINILLCKPLQEWQTKTAILMKGGRETGETLLGESSVLLGDDVVSKRHYANFTLYMTSLVYKPANIHVIDDIAVHSYLGGRNNTFMEPGYFQDLVTRYNMVPAKDKNRPSILSIAMPCTAQKLNPYIDIRGAWDSNQDQGPWHYPTAGYYRRLYRLSSINNISFLDPQDASTNTTLCRGHSESYNAATGNFDKITMAKGHFGPNVYAGMMRVLEGNTAVLKDMKYEQRIVHTIGSQLRGFGMARGLGGGGRGGPPPAGAGPQNVLVAGNIGDEEEENDDDIESVTKSFVHVQIDPEKCKNCTTDDAEQLKGVISDADLDLVKKSIETINQPTQYTQEENDASHVGNLSYLESKVDASVDAPSKYNKAREGIKDVQQQAAFTHYVGSQITEGPESLKKNVLVQLDLLQGSNKKSNAYKNTLKKMLLSKAEDPMASQINVYGYVDKNDYDSKSEWFKVVDPITKAECAEEDATITRTERVIPIAETQ